MRLIHMSGRSADALGIAAALSIAVTAVPARADDARAHDARAHNDWRAAISKTPTPHEGCFQAAYPALAWTEVTCKSAPKRPYMPRHGKSGRTVGNGDDFAIGVSGLISTATGSFPSVTGLKSETGYGGASNYYSLQLNSNFFTTTACNGGSTASECQGWQQFVYSSSETSAFMQYWLINYGSSCPSGGWEAYQGSCYKNSAAVNVPQLAITGLSGFKIAGTAVSGGTDTMVFTTSSTAYSTTGKDSVTVLAKGWNQAEFNVVGDGGGSNAKFNSGTKVTVEIAVKDGSTAKPTCESDDGTTGETNNLKLGSCTAASGATPSISFTESN